MSMLIRFFIILCVFLGVHSQEILTAAAPSPSKEVVSRKRARTESSDTEGDRKSAETPTSEATAQTDEGWRWR